MGDFIDKIKFYILILFNKQTPWFVKLMLLFGILYLIYPFDLISDLIPFLGLVDDLTIGTSIVALALKLIPKEVVEDVSRKMYGEKHKKNEK